MTRPDQIRFWGVRGSIPVPGDTTASVGGNTSCVELVIDDQHVVLDAGTGLRQLGMARGEHPLDTTLLVSHLHWDHVQGVPFFGPLYDPRASFRFVGPPGLRDALESQMSRPAFPVGMEVMGAERVWITVEPGHGFRIGDVKVSTCKLNHPGGATGYRLDGRRHSVVYACDHEMTPAALDPDLLELARGADLLIADAQYTPDEYPTRIGWGHGTWESAVALAQSAGVGALALTHHEPTRDDAAVARIEARARRRFPHTWAAREGRSLRLSDLSVAWAAAEGHHRQEVEPCRAHGIA